jgi:hypothetical protein
LVNSQFATLEDPSQEADVITLDATQATDSSFLKSFLLIKSERIRHNYFKPKANSGDQYGKAAKIPFQLGRPI